MSESDKLTDLIVRTAAARRDYWRTGAWSDWRRYENLYIALGRRALCPRTMQLLCPLAMLAMCVLAIEKR